MCFYDCSSLLLGRIRDDACSQWEAFEVPADASGCLSNHTRLPVAAANLFKLAFGWLLMLQLDFLYE